MPVQNTFTLIPERCVAPNGNTPHRPMTSKQVKKAHKAANKGPKLSRMEQRKLELAEQERIRKELEKDRVAARARAARERKKAKEDAKKDEKRRSGKPLIDVRPSQDTIARFVRGNGSGKKRDGSGQEIQKMPSVAEEAAEECDDPNFQDETTASPGAETSAVGGPKRSNESEMQRESPIEQDSALSLSNEKQFETNNPDRAPTTVSSRLSEPRSSLNGKLLPEPPLANESATSLPVMQPARVASPDQIAAELDTRPNHPMPPASFSVDAIDDEMLAELDCITGLLPARRGLATDVNLEVPQELPITKADTQDEIQDATQEMIFDDFDDDMFNDLRTSFARKEGTQNEQKAERNLPPASSQYKDDFADADLEDDAFEALDAMLGLPPPSTYKSRKLSPRASPFQREGQPTRRREFSSFTEGDLDDELLQQLEADAESSSARVNPAKSADQGPPAVKEMEDAELEAEYRSPELPRNVLAPVRRSPPQLEPSATQIALYEFVDNFPTPSQQELDLDVEMPPPAPQLTPCPPPKKTASVPSQNPMRPPEPEQKKQFFSPSGENVLLATAIHRSKRDAQLERERRQAGAFITTRQHRVPPPSCMLPQPPTGNTPTTNLAAHQRSQAGKPTFKQLPVNINSPRHPPVSGRDHPPPFNQAEPAAKPVEAQPTFKPTISMVTEKENVYSAEDLLPMASQETEYGGGWIDEIDHDLLSEKVHATVVR